MDNNAIRPGVSREIESILSSSEEGQNFSLNYFRPLNETEMVAIAEAISCSTRIHSVWLRRCLEGSPTAATSAFFKKIFETHPSIKEICLADNGIDNNLAEVIGIALKTNTSLKRLELSGNVIGPHGAESLAEDLSHNKALEVLYLSRNLIGDTGAMALAEALCVNKTLEKLDLGESQVTEIGAKALASATEKASLKELHLGCNDLQDEGGKAIAQSISKNKSLTSLALFNTGIGDETCKALAAALCNNSTLRVLDLDYNNRITDVGAKALEDTLKHLNYTLEYIGFSYFGTGVTRDQIAQNRHLNAFFQQVNQNVPTIPLGIWPRVLEAVECKPDLLFALLKTKPEVCRELQLHSRRRRRPDWQRY